MEPVPTGSVQLPVEAERYTIIIHHSDCGTHAVNKQLGCVRVLFGIGLEHVGLRPTTISLLWRERKPTCNIALYSATLPYVIRIVTTGQRLKMSSCDRGVSVLYNSMQVFPPPTQYRGIVVGSENTQHRVIQHKQTNNSLATATSAAAAWSRLTTGSMRLTAEAVR
jgi:hypothetical protein